MNRSFAIAERQYQPAMWVPLGIAAAIHMALIAWNPTLMGAGPDLHAPPMMQVIYKDEMPVVEPPKSAVVPPKPKPEVKKKTPPPKKSHKSGISISKKPPVVVVHHAIAKPTPKPFISKITIPKFVPHAMEDEPIAASPIPGIAIASPQHAVQAYKPPPVLKSKTRGIRAQDINFEIADKSSIDPGTQIVAIPVGEESGDTAVLPNAPALHNAPKGIHSLAGYNFKPGAGTGELAGKNRVGFHGDIAAPIDTGENETATGGQTKTTIGQGFEVAGPVGDRKILHRRLPEYPAWAEEKGITAMVRIYFTVKPDGSIRSNMRIQLSSGYSDLDQLAKDALMNWKFSPTSATAEEAWGIITFRFTLS